MKKAFDGQCATPDCKKAGQVVEVMAERSKGDILQGAVCSECRGNLRTVFRPLAISAGGENGKSRRAQNESMIDGIMDKGHENCSGYEEDRSRILDFCERTGRKIEVGMAVQDGDGKGMAGLFRLSGPDKLKMN